MKKFLFIALMLASSAVIAADTKTADSGAQPPQKVKKICRADVATGSIMPKRICHTKEQWEAIDRQNASAAGNAIDGQERGLGNTGGNVPVG